MRKEVYIITTGNPEGEITVFTDAHAPSSGHSEMAKLLYASCLDNIRKPFYFWRCDLESGEVLSENAGPVTKEQRRHKAKVEETVARRRRAWLLLAGRRTPT